MTPICNNTSSTADYAWAYSLRTEEDLTKIIFYASNNLDTSNTDPNLELKDGYIYITDGNVATDNYNALKSTNDEKAKKASIIMYYGYNGVDGWRDGGIEFTYAGDGKFIAKNVNIEIDCNYGFKLGFYEGSSFQQYGWLTGSGLTVNDENIYEGIRLNSPAMEKNENNNGTMKLSGIYTLTIDMSNVKNIRLYAVKSENGQDSDDQTTSDVDFRVISSCLGSYNLENSSDLGDIQVAVDIINKEGKLNSTRFDRYQYDYTFSDQRRTVRQDENNSLL
jgi:hypothetical protein